MNLRKTLGICSGYFSKNANMHPWFAVTITDFLSWVVSVVPTVQTKYHSKTNQKKTNKQICILKGCELMCCQFPS